MILNHNLTADRVNSPMGMITAIVSLKDKASMEAKVMANLKAMAVKATDSPKAMDRPKDMVTKATTTRAMEAKAMTLKVTAIKAMVPKAYLKEAMADHQAMVVHKEENHLTRMTRLMILLPNIFKGSRQ